MVFQDASQQPPIKGIIHFTADRVPITDADFTTLFKTHKDKSVPNYKMPIPIGASMIVGDSNLGVYITRQAVDTYRVVYDQAQDLENLFKKLGYTRKQLANKERVYFVNPNYAFIVTRPGRCLEIHRCDPTNYQQINKGSGLTFTPDTGMFTALFK